MDRRLTRWGILAVCSVMILQFSLNGAAAASVLSNGISLEDGFDNPPLSARPRAYWAWMNGNVSIPHLTKDLEEMKDKGLGGLDIFDIGARDPFGVVPEGVEFLGKESMEAIGHAVREAGQKREYLVIHGNLQSPAAGIKAGQKLRAGALIGTVGDTELPGRPYLRLEARQVRGGIDPESIPPERLVLPAYTVACDLRNVAPLAAP